jgi:hypothetical protein
MCLQLLTAQACFEHACVHAALQGTAAPPDELKMTAIATIAEFILGGSHVAYT